MFDECGVLCAKVRPPSAVRKAIMTAAVIVLLLVALSGVLLMVVNRRARVSR